MNNNIGNLVSECKKGSQDTGNEIFEDIIHGGSYILSEDVCCDKYISPDNLSCADLSNVLPRYKLNECSRHR